MARSADRSAEGVKNEPASRVAPLIWLKARHVRSEVMFWATALGVDPETGRDLIDRIYNVYLFVILAAWTCVTWVELLSAADGMFLHLGPDEMDGPASLLVLAPLLTLLFKSLSSLRVSPLKLIDADLPFQLAAGFSPTAMAVTDAVPSMIAAAIASFLGAFLFGSALDRAGANLSVWTLAGAFCLTEAAALAGGRAVGFARLSFARSKHAGRDRAAFSLLIVAVEVALIAAVVRGLDAVGFMRALRIGFNAASPLTGGFVALALLGAAIVVLVRSSARMDVIRAVEESGLYAALFGVRHMALIDRDLYFALRRRQNIARRRLRPTIPLARGAAAPVSRAVLTHLRQFESLPWLVLLGALEVPMCAWFVSQPRPWYELVAWGGLVVFVSGHPVRELGLAFRDDMALSLFRDHLPFSNTQLALLDAIPSTVFTTVLALAVTVGVSIAVPGSFSALTPVLVMLFVIGIALGAIFDGIEIMLQRMRMTSLISLILIVAAAGACSLASEGAVVTGLAAVCLLFAGVLFRNG